MYDTTVLGRLSTTPIRPEYNPTHPYVFSKRELIHTGLTLDSLLPHRAPDYARVPMTVAKPNVSIPPTTSPKSSLLAGLSRLRTPLKFHRLAEPTLLTYLSHTEH